MLLTPMAWLNLSVKCTLVALIGFYLLRPDLPQFEGKIMPFRAIGFPIAAMLVPAAWWLWRRNEPYPHLPDALIVTATITDFGGNALHLYQIGWFDHVVHFVNMILLASAFGMLISSHPMQPWMLAGLTLGFGAVLHTIWEIFEYHITDIIGAGLDVAAETTIRDFTVGLVGSTIGAYLAYRYFWRYPELGGAILGGDTSAGPARRQET
jgi:hypothetical protein